MTNTDLPNDKFVMPNLPEICAPRQSLLHLLHREASNRIIYVSAPAGYGKTVSTQLWLKSSNFVYIYIGLDEYDNTLSIFYKLFCSGILALQPENRNMANILAKPEFSLFPIEYTIHLLSAFVPDGRQYMVVLDNMHLVTNAEIRTSGLLIQKRFPRSFLTLILTRNEITEEYLTSTGTEKCAVIAKNELAFTTEEIRFHFKAYRHILTREEAVAIWEATSGWAIAIDTLAISGDTMFKKNGSQILEHYLEKQIWNKWDKDLQNFLLRISTTDTLNVDLCNCLTERTDSQKVLESLSKSNIFIRKSSEDTYHCHPLFTNFLMNMLKQNQHIDKRKLYRKTAEWFYNRKEYLNAANYYVKLNDAEGISNCLILVQDYTLDYNFEPLHAFTKTYIWGKFPQFLIDKNPGILIQCTLSCFWDGDAIGFCRYIDILSTMTVPPHWNKETLFLLNSLDFRKTLYAYSAEYTKLLPMAAGSTQCKDKRANIISLTQHLPFVHRATFDCSEFALHTRERLLSLESTFSRHIGREYYVLEDCIRAGLCYEKNQLTDALCYGLSALAKCEDGFGTEVKFCISMILITIYVAMGKWEHAREQEKAIEALIEVACAEYLRPNLLAIETRLKLLDGAPNVAQDWLSQYFVTEQESLAFYKIFQHFTTARAYIATGQIDNAMGYISNLAQLEMDYKRPLGTAEAGVLKATLEWALGQKKEALDTMETVLKALQNYGFIRIISNEGAAVLPILKKLNTKIQKDSYNGSIQPAYLHEIILATHKQSKNYKGIAFRINVKQIKLSKQQKLILTYLSKGYKYKEIATETCLTIHTVKSHASATYAKLGVCNSTDAVLKARDLNLMK